MSVVSGNREKLIARPRGKSARQRRWQMGAPRSIAEVLELAVAREIQTAEFYSEVAGRMRDPAMRAVFARLC